MTQIIFLKDADHNFIGFECDGHSGFARRGKDIVCAAISALTINAVNSLDELIGAELDVQTDEKTGYISCKLLSDSNEKTNLIFGSLELGMLGIARDYGSKYCKVNYKED